MSNKMNVATNNVNINLDASSEQEEKLVEAVAENSADKYLIYGVNEAPPIHITVVCALQVRRYSQM